jgi:hypothetical protein
VDLFYFEIVDVLNNIYALLQSAIASIRAGDDARRIGGDFMELIEILEQKGFRLRSGSGTGLILIDWAGRRVER